MATAFRATVMLVVLVGLPAAWVYYGPLPPAAMGVIERTILSAKQSIGWDSPMHTASWSDGPQKTAPRFDAELATARQTLQQPAPTFAATPTTPVISDSKFSLASVSIPAAPNRSGPSHAEVDATLADKLEPHLSLLRSLDAADYTLENWGGEGELYRFRCAIALGESDDHTRQFEAIDADPLRAVHQVVGEVTAWQNARHAGTRTLLR